MSLYPSNEAFLAATGGGGGLSTFPVEIFTGTIKNLVVDDNLKFFVMDNAVGQLIAIPEDSSEDFPIGAEMEFIREGVGALTFLASGIAVFKSRDFLSTINSQYSVAALKKIAINQWRLFGDLA